MNIWPGLHVSTRNSLRVSLLEPLPGRYGIIETIYFGSGPPLERFGVKYDYVETCDIRAGRENESRGGNASPGDCRLWLRIYVFDGPRKDLIGTLHFSEGPYYIHPDEEMPLPDTWIEWLRFQMERIGGEYDKEVEHRCIAKGLLQYRGHQVLKILLLKY